MATKKTRFALSTEQFKNGLRPTQGDFADVFESFINFEDDLDEDAEPVHFKNGLRVGSGPANPLDGTVRWKEGNFQVYRQIGNQGKWITLGGGLWLSNSAGNIHSDGKNVGIGTPDPKAPLDFGESTNPRRKLALFQYRDGNGFYGLGVSSETLELYSGKDPLEDPDMVIKQWSGSVGIGTLSPDPNVKLHVNGDVKIEGVLKVLKQEAWKEAELAEAEYYSEPGTTVAYYKDSQLRVHFKGTVMATKETYAPIFTLDEGYRPSENLKFTVLVSNAPFMSTWILIDTMGVVSSLLKPLTKNAIVPLDGISFRI